MKVTIYTGRTESFAYSKEAKTRRELFRLLREHFSSTFDKYDDWELCVRIKKLPVQPGYETYDPKRYRHYRVQYSRWYAKKHYVSNQTFLMVVHNL